MAEKKFHVRRKPYKFFSVWIKKVSTSDKNNLNNGGQDEDKEEDRSAVDCCVEEGTDDLLVGLNVIVTKARSTLLYWH